MRYAIITPARNEERNLPRLADALRAQTLAPAAWVIVDDASDDDTPRMAAALEVAEPWVRHLRRENPPAGGLAAGRREGRDLLAFREGMMALTEPVDIFIKVDADIDVEPHYFAALVDHFATDERLAIASGTCYEMQDGSWRRRTKAAGTVWGACRAYRWDCVADVQALEPRMGWDGLDEVRVGLRGMHSKTFVDLPFHHHRTEGGRELSSLHQGAALGRASWYMGYRPTFLAIRALYRARENPAALGMIWGYAAAGIARERQCPEADLIAAVRDRQRLRNALRAGTPSS